MLKPGGKLLISDYCRAPGTPSDAFAAYIAQRGYDLHSVDDYGSMLTKAGFVDVKAEDRTWQACTNLLTKQCFLIEVSTLGNISVLYMLKVPSQGRLCGCEAEACL